MSEELQEQIDVNKIGCKIVDVHACLQKAFDGFVQSGGNSLDDLAKRIHESMSEIPVFLIGDQA